MEQEPLPREVRPDPRLLRYYALSFLLADLSSCSLCWPCIFGTARLTPCPPAGTFGRA